MFAFYFINALILIVFIIYKLKNKRFNQLMALIPGPEERYPLLGNLDMFWSNSFIKQQNVLSELYIALCHVYADQGLFKSKNGPIHTVSIFRNDLVQDFLKDNKNLEKPFEYQILYDWLGKGLLINDNSVLWKQRRKLLTPAFHFKIIEDFIPLFNEKSNILINNLSTFIGAESFDLSPLLFSCTLDAIAETTLGFKLNSQQNENRDYFEAVHRVNKNFFYRLTRPWLFNDNIYYMTKSGKEFKSDLKILHGLTRKVINERKENIMKNRINCNSFEKKRKRLAFLDLLLDIHLKDNSFSLEDIREEVDTFMFAGHDTSACCLTWTFYLLGLYPDIQRRLQNELDSIISKDMDITIDDIKQMPYLEAVIKESLRLYPPVPIISRKITEDLKLGPYVIPKGVSLFLIIERLHKDPNVFPEPLLFKPERFLNEELIQSKTPFCFTPFSGGSRSCIGQKYAMNEIKIIVAKVLMKYNLKSLENRTEIIVFNGIVSKPANGLKMQIKPRYN